MSQASVRKVEFLVTEESAGLRLDKALTHCSEIASRSQAAKLISRGLIQLNENILKASYTTQLNDKLVLSLPLQETSDLIPYEFQLDILHEDEDLIVVNKPAGLVVHPANGHEHDTLVNALVHHTKDLSLGFQENRPGLIHRLDRDTSGVLVVAKNELAQTRLAKQFQKKTAKRRYWSIVYGEFKASQGTISSYLARHPNDRKKFASLKTSETNMGVHSERGKYAVTHYKVRAAHSGLSLIELKLETGRTHQIRIHLSENHHPVVGDEVYGNKSRALSLKSMTLRQTIQTLNRFALHAFELGFVHPRSLEWVEFFAPWPQDLAALAQQAQIVVPHTPGSWENE